MARFPRQGAAETSHSKARLQKEVSYTFPAAPEVLWVVQVSVNPRIFRKLQVQTKCWPSFNTHVLRPLLCSTGPTLSCSLQLGRGLFSEKKIQTTGASGYYINGRLGLVRFMNLRHKNIRGRLCPLSLTASALVGLLTSLFSFATTSSEGQMALGAS